MTLIGTSIGSIRCDELLAEGGMGQVYLGVDERLDRKVALKVIRPDTRTDSSARRRFRREARTLSQVEHANVCRLYDLVERDDGDVLVLEYVEGEDLRSALEHGLSLRSKVAIAEQIARALVAAHAMSVIHRDLKPDNIRITPDGVVKVLDFGLARTVAGKGLACEPGPAVQGHPSPQPPEGDSAGSLSLTGLGDLIGTPRYMSPEQARGEHLTAASDMYSFGLLLQEMLTGRCPTGDLAQHEVLVRRMRWGDTEPVRGVPAALAQLIRRLLSLAPQKRPSAVETVAALRHFRERPRRRLLRLSAAIAVASLLAGAIASGLGYLHAQRSLVRANQAHAQSEAVNQFLTDVLESARPRAMGIDVKVVDVLDAAGARIDEEFAEHPRNLVAVHATLGSTYNALSLYDQAEHHLRRALAVGRQELGREDPDTVKALHSLGETLGFRSQWQESEQALTEVIDIRRRTLGPDHPDTLAAISSLAWTCYSRRLYDRAQDLYRRVLDGRLRVLGEDDPKTIASMAAVARILAAQQRWQEAEELLTTILDRQQRLVGPDHRSTLGTMSSLATLYARTGRWHDSVALNQKLLEATRRVLGPDHSNTFMVTANLAAGLIKAGRATEAERLLTDAYQRARSALGEAHANTLQLNQLLGAVLTDLGRLDEAEALYREAIAMARREYGDDHQETWKRRLALARLQAERGQTEQAAVTMYELLERHSDALGAEHPVTRSIASELAAVLRDLGRGDEAAAIVARHRGLSTPE